MNTKLDETPLSQPTNESPLSAQPGTTPTGTPPKRTAAEQAIVDSVAQTHGRECAERHAERVIYEAKMIGDLTSDGQVPPD